MVKIMLVKNLENKNQFVIENEKEGKYYFQSYESLIAEINEKGELILGQDWDYSRTTLKHLYIFLDEYKNKISNKKIYDLIVNFNNCRNKKDALNKLINDKKIKIDFTFKSI